MLTEKDVKFCQFEIKSCQTSSCNSAWCKNGVDRRSLALGGENYGIRREKRRVDGCAGVGKSVRKKLFVAIFHNAVLRHVHAVFVSSRRAFLPSPAPVLHCQKAGVAPPLPPSAMP